MKLSIGSKVRDKITGFEGVVTGKASYITGCDQYLVQPPVKADGDFVEGKWCDDGRLTVIEENAVAAEDVTGDANGADIPAPIK